MDIASFLEQELGKLCLPTFEITVRQYSEVYPHSQDTMNSEQIKITIGSKSESPWRDTECSFLDFWYNKEANRLEHINYFLLPELRGKGLGRRLVEIMEKTGQGLGCDNVRIDVDVNPSFWKHIGYRREKYYWEKKITQG
jgi:GNAT superfamily N-acetyltransferase